MPVEHGVYHTYDNVLRMAFDTELLPTLRKDVQSAVERNVTEELANAIRDSVYMNVYDAYYNKQYVRRGDKGGLSDTRKYMRRAYSMGDSETVAEVSVEVLGSKQYLNIVPIVESGRGYTWKHSAIYQSKQPRPFLDKAVEMIIQDGSALGAVAEYLIQHGWQVYAPYTRKHTPQQDHGNPNAIADALAREMFGYADGEEAEDGDIF